MQRRVIVVGDGGGEEMYTRLARGTGWRSNGAVHAGAYTALFLLIPPPPPLRLPRLLS